MTPTNDKKLSRFTLLSSESSPVGRGLIGLGQYTVSVHIVRLAMTVLLHWCVVFNLCYTSYSLFQQMIPLEL